ncbi:hypothetical protein NQZ79_g1681 [Umbelopsis isabellina]|nr:hypothetical protein NQZ79_g1681 [Umbelopsis isabellina]
MSSQIARELADSAIEREVDQFLRQSNIRPAKPFDIASIHVPESQVTEKTVRYVHDSVEAAIFNHSNRVYFLGATLVQDYLPQWKFDEETYFLTSLFHDIGTASKLQLSSVLSFEFIGGIHAREKLMEFGARQVQADEVAEAIFRHTDAKGGNTRHAGQIIQMSTQLDVLGTNPQWFNPNTIDQVVQKYPRLGFNHVFADQMRQEVAEKPGCLMCTRDSHAFINQVESNPIMARYDNN